MNKVICDNFQNLYLSPLNTPSRLRPHRVLGLVRCKKRTWSLKRHMCREGGFSKGNCSAQLSGAADVWRGRLSGIPLKVLLYQDFVRLCHFSWRDKDAVTYPPGGLGWTCPPHFCRRSFLRLIKIRWLWGQVGDGGNVSGSVRWKARVDC